MLREVGHHTQSEVSGALVARGKGLHQHNPGVCPQVQRIEKPAVLQDRAGFLGVCVNDLHCDSDNRKWRLNCFDLILRSSAFVQVECA